MLKKKKLWKFNILYHVLLNEHRLNLELFIYRVIKQKMKRVHQSIVLMDLSSKIARMSLSETFSQFRIYHIIQISVKSRCNLRCLPVTWVTDDTLRSVACQ